MRSFGNDWSVFFAAVGDAPNEASVSLLSDYPFLKGVCVDLGAGNCRDAKFFLRSSFDKVYAVDTSLSTHEFLIQGIELHSVSMETFTTATCSVDLVYAYDSLCFLEKRKLILLFRSALEMLKPGGIFYCNLLGFEDGWVGKNGIYVLSEDDVNDLISSFKTLSLKRVNGTRKTCIDTLKRSDEFHLVLQK